METRETLMKPITVYKQDLEIIEKIKNFSMFVRFCLRQPELLEKYKEYYDNRN
jgi:hypothetical protein